MWHLFQDSLMNKKFKIEIVCNILNVFTVTHYQCNVSLLNKSIQIFLNNLILTPNGSEWVQYRI